MTLRLYADECVDARIIARLRLRGIDVVTAADEGLLGAADGAHVERATDLGRVIVSSDHDFLRLVHARVGAGAPHPGLFFILPRTAVGAAIRSLALATEVLDGNDMDSWVEWLDG